MFDRFFKKQHAKMGMRMTIFKKNPQGLGQCLFFKNSSIGNGGGCANLRERKINGSKISH
jgi:hypothetical protein